jgi:hypothetical protein
VLVLAGAGIAVYLATRTSEPPREPSARARPAPFIPPGVTFTAQQETPAVGIYTAGPAALDTLTGAYTDALAEFDQFLVARGTHPVAVAGLNVIAVPRGVLCDPATSTERGRRRPPPGKCSDWVYYYRPTDRSLVVAGEPEVLGRALRLGIADYFALHHRTIEADARAFAEKQGK